jgi:uncharacterized protein (TIGR03437 family)
VTVATAAPAIFFDSEAGIVTDLNFQLVGRAGAPARKGDYIIVYTTGMPMTGSGAVTGRLAEGIRNAGTATATVDGRPATVLANVASPGYLGLYQTYVMIPAETRSGTVPLVLKVGDAESNRVNIVVQ